MRDNNWEKREPEASATTFPAGIRVALPRLLAAGMAAGGGTLLGARIELSIPEPVFMQMADPSIYTIYVLAPIVAVAMFCLRYWDGLPFWARPAVMLPGSVVAGFWLFECPEAGFPPWLIPTRSQLAEALAARASGLDSVSIIITLISGAIVGMIVQLEAEEDSKVEIHTITSDARSLIRILALSPELVTRLAVAIVGPERAPELREEWRSHLRGLGSGWKPRRDACGFVVAAVTYRWRDAIDLLWRVVDAVLGSRNGSGVAWLLITSSIWRLVFMHRGGLAALLPNLSVAGLVGAGTYVLILAARRWRSVKPPERHPPTKGRDDE